MGQFNSSPLPSFPPTCSAGNLVPHFSIHEHCMIIALRSPSPLHFFPLTLVFFLMSFMSCFDLSPTSSLFPLSLPRSIPFFSLLSCLFSPSPAQATKLGGTARPERFCLPPNRWTTHVVHATPHAAPFLPIFPFSFGSLIARKPAD